MASLMHLKVIKTCGHGCASSASHCSQAHAAQAAEATAAAPAASSSSSTAPSPQLEAFLDNTYELQVWQNLLRPVESLICWYFMYSVFGASRQNLYRSLSGGVSLAVKLPACVEHY